MPKRTDSQSSIDIRERWGTGWKPDAFDERDYAAAARFGAPRSLPSEALGLRDFIRRVKDQASSSSCVGQAISSAIDTRIRRLKIAWPEPSSVAPYIMARRIATPKGTKLADDGCFPRDAMKAVREVGLPSEEAVPFDLSKMNDDLTWADFQDASKLIVFQWFRIYAQGASRADEVANALSQGIPVVCGIDLDAGFFRYNGGVIEAWGPERKGGHMVTIVGYRTNAHGFREFLVLNSWGERWGIGGFFWLHEDALASGRVSDLYALVVSP
jgi:hypothetical protein